MKKLLLSSAAVCGLVMIASPAQAQLTVDLGGWFKGYGFWTDQDDDAAAAEARDFDIIRSTEVHIGGETTLDNGLTVGAHLEMEADASGPDDSFDVQESYVYGSGGWGRVNFGAEDGAAYLLQVEAPSADSNLDGIRQYVNPVNYAALPGGTGLGALAANPGGGAVGAGAGVDGLDYDQDITGYTDKITYLSPILNGFQLGVSYTPDVADASTEDALNFDDVDGALGEAWEAAARYEGMFNNVGIILGAGYSMVDLEDNTTVGAGLEDDRTAWNVGIDLDIGPFGVGAAYMEDDFGEPAAGAGDDEKTMVVGVDYTTGPFKIGASFLDIENTANLAGSTAGDGIDSQRWAGGVVYTYGPGMTFRGSISQVEHEDVPGLTTGDDFDATSVVIGTQINF